MKQSKANIQLIIFLVALFFALVSHAQNEKDRPVSYEDDIAVGWRTEGDSAKFVMSNKMLVPLEVVVRDRATDEEKYSYLLPELDSIVVLRYKTNNLDSIKDFVSEKLRISYYMGHPDRINIDTNYVYRIPAKKGKRINIMQSWNGKFSHDNDLSRYAIDFTLKVGARLYAAREGLVIKTIDWFTKQGGRELMAAANKVLILHDDGTIAHYVHIDYKGVKVKVGERVKKGQLIGISGFTGFTTKPHLHFVVRKARHIAIPVYFKGYGGRKLKRGRNYKVLK